MVIQPPPEQATYEVQTIVGKLEICVRSYKPTYDDNAGFETAHVTWGPSDQTSWTNYFEQTRLGQPPIPRPEPEPNDDEGWEWE